MANRLKQMVIGLILFIFILSLFSIAAYSEYKLIIENQERELLDNVSILQAQIDNHINLRIRNIMGLIAYININPDIIESEFEAFSSSLIPKDDRVVRNITIIKDTTISFVYPKSGNESAVGIDLSKIKEQSEIVLSVKNSGEMMMTGPINLVQGGTGLVVRIPVILNLNSDEPKYWGQISLVVNFDELIMYSGIQKLFDEFQIEIVQVDSQGNAILPIISNHKYFSPDAISSTIYLPNTFWKVTIDYLETNRGKNIVYFLLIVGVVIGLLIVYYTISILNSKDKLQNSFIELENTQNKLIVAEKLSMIGKLGGGVAHEINTPLGLCITLATFVEQKLDDFKKNFEAGTISKQDVSKCIDETSESMKSMTFNYKRICALVTSFKTLVNNTDFENFKKVNLKNSIDKIIGNLMPQIQKNNHFVKIKSIDDIEIYTDPSVLNDIIENLVMNSLIHGFEFIENGCIDIEIYSDFERKMICIKYHDNGVGISQNIKERIFEPFFTTKNHEGKIGLGLFILQNTVVQKLKGSVEFESIQGEGVTFKIEFPQEFS